MTVCTNHVALCNLVEHVVPVAVPDAVRNPEFLVSQVVELKYDGIGLAAIYAWVIAKVGNEEDHSFLAQGSIPSCGGIDIALFVGPIVLLLVLGTTRPAIRIPLPSRPPMPGEVLGRFLRLAARASAHGRNI
jgi:hypothetical protein